MLFKCRCFWSVGTPEYLHGVLVSHSSMHSKYVSNSCSRERGGVTSLTEVLHEAPI